MTIDESLTVIMELVPTLADSQVRVIRQMLETQRGEGFESGEEYAHETVGEWYEPEPPEGEDQD